MAQLLSLIRMPLLYTRGCLWRRSIWQVLWLWAQCVAGVGDRLRQGVGDAVALAEGSGV